MIATTLGIYFAIGLALFVGLTLYTWGDSAEINTLEMHLFTLLICTISWPFVLWVLLKIYREG